MDSWKERFAGREVGGFRNAIHTTGSSLSWQHAKWSELQDPEYQIDTFVVGPLYDYVPPEPFDFIIDFFGAAFHFPEDIMPYYGNNLAPGGLLLARQDFYTVADVKRFLENINNLGIGCEGIGYQNNWSDENENGFMLDMLLRKMI